MAKLYLFVLFMQVGTLFGMSKSITPCKQSSRINSLQRVKRDFCTASKKQALLFEATPHLWARYFDKAIRHKILNKSFDPKKECEHKQWIVKDEVGEIWEKYDKTAVIKFTGEKIGCLAKHTNTHIHEYKNGHVQDWIVESRPSQEPWIFFHHNEFFDFDSNKERMRFISKAEPHFHFEMKVNIGEKKKNASDYIKEYNVPALSLNNDFNTMYRVGIKYVLPVLKEFELDIPCGLELKGTKNDSWQPIKNPQELEWTSISANGQNIITQLKSSYYLWSIEHITNKLTPVQLALLAWYWKK